MPMFPQYPVAQQALSVHFASVSRATGARTPSLGICQDASIRNRAASTDEDHFYSSMSHDLHVHSGAKLLLSALQSLLKPRSNKKEIEIEEHTSAEATMSDNLRLLDVFSWRALNNTKVLRIREEKPLRIDIPHRPTDLTFDMSQSRSLDCLLIHDDTRIWRTSKAAARKVAGFLENGATADCPRVLLTMGDRLPLLHEEKNGLSIRGESVEVWKHLWRHKDKVAVICSANSLRGAGAFISRRLSWEQTIEDIFADIRRFALLQCLSRFGYLIIRFGYAGILCLRSREHEGVKGPKALDARFVFVPRAKAAGLFRDETEDGRIVGLNHIIVASLLSQMSACYAESSNGISDDGVSAALRHALTISMLLFDSGFPCTSSDAYRVLPGEKVPRQRYIEEFFRGNGFNKDLNEDLPGILCENLAQKRAKDASRYVGEINLKSVLGSLRSGKRRREWQILRSQIKDNGMSRINLGIAICRFGHQHLLNRPPSDDDQKAICGISRIHIDKILTVPECRLSQFDQDEKPLKKSSRIKAPTPPGYCSKPPAAKIICTPVLEFGKLVVIERDEIESLRSIRNLMKSYQEGRTLQDRPMSIAVFGAPGSGKSFAVKQIAADINSSIAEGSRSLEIVECNVAQFREVEDLGNAIARIASLNLQHKIPLVFFDEFDCNFEKISPLGWLKYFLAPMQDGTYYTASQTVTFGRAIFVFAGGVYRTIAEFNPYTKCVSARRNPKEYQNVMQRRKVFKGQKGPDFVSRLRGYIDILSVNPDSTAPRDEENDRIKPILRRALTLRGQILNAKLVANRGGCEVASIDDDVLYALLTIDHYRHGVRSMEAILHMCTPINGVIAKASLPSRSQLNMHVDADEFFVRVQRGRFRHSIVPQEKGASDDSDVESPKREPEHRRSLGAAGDVGRLNENRLPGTLSMGEFRRGGISKTDREPEHGRATGNRRATIVIDGARHDRASFDALHTTQ